MKKSKNTHEFPRISIIILNYNCKQFLNRCLSTVLKSDYPAYEVIFVDNNSSDGSIEFFSSNYKNIKNLLAIKLSSNYGFSIGNNIGAKYSKGEYLVFLNPDTEVDPLWLKKLVEGIRSDSSIGIVQPKILLMNSNNFDTAGCFLNHYGIAYSRGHGKEDKGQYNKIEEIFYAKGAALMIKRDLWEKLGGFDDVFFTYYEETDLCWRAWKSGSKVVYVPNAIVHHFGGAVLRKLSYHLKFHEARGRVVLLLKHYSLVNITKYVPILMLLHLLNVLRQLVKKNVIASKAIIAGTVWCLFDFKEIWLSRKNLQRSLNQTSIYDATISKLLSVAPKILRAR